MDIRIGDRRNGCKGPMQPVAVWVRPDGEWTLLHRCSRCGQIRPNRIAGDDSEIVLLSLALQPLARPAFPLDRLALMAGLGGSESVKAERAD